jgi:drug/metabolite transporter superfamily protein YnfA
MCYNENNYQYGMKDDDKWTLVKSIGYFMLAGLLEIGGGYFIWLWVNQLCCLWCPNLNRLWLHPYITAC